MKTIYWLDCQAYCACRKVEARPLENEDGTLTDRWVCTVCGCEFVRRAAVRRLAEQGEVYRVAISDKVTNQPLVILTRGGIKMGDKVLVRRAEEGTR